MTDDSTDDCNRNGEETGIDRYRPGRNDDRLARRDVIDTHGLDSPLRERGLPTSSEDALLGRRAFVSAVGALGLSALAGCSGDGQEPGVGEGETNSTSERPPATETEDATETATETDTGPQPIYSVPDSYEFEGEGTIESEGETYDATLAGTWADGDIGYTWDMDLDQGPGELDVYIVDGQFYVATGDTCSPGEDYEYDLQAGFIEDHPDSFYDVEPSETTEYDGESVRVYEFPYDELPDRYDDVDDGSLTLYVSTESGYVIAEDLVIVNNDDAAGYDLTLEFFSFDENLSVELPSGC